MNRIPDKLYLWETPIINGGYDPKNMIMYTRNFHYTI